MKTFEASIDAAAPAERLFALSQDYDHRLDWDPFLIEARLLDGATRAGVGVRAWCVSRRPRIGMETEYVSFDPPRTAAVKMTRGPWFIARFAGSWRFEPGPAGATRVVFRYSLEARPRLLGWLLARVFAADTKRRLAALARAAAAA